MQIFDTRHNNTKSILITLENNAANYKVLQKFIMSLNLILKYIICGLNRGEELAHSRLQQQLIKLEMRYCTIRIYKKKEKVLDLC